MITFNEAIAKNYMFVLSPDCKSEIKGWFTNERVDRNTVPDGWYAYDFRHTSNGNLCSLEDHVSVNHGGTFLAQTPVKMNRNGYRSLSGRGGYTFL